MKPSFIKDYITVYDDVITPESCDNLVNFFEKNIDESFKNEREHMSFRELGLQNFPQYRDETNELFHSFIEQYKTDNNISDALPSHASTSSTSSSELSCCVNVIDSENR